MCGIAGQFCYCGILQVPDYMGEAPDTGKKSQADLTGKKPVIIS